MKITKTELKSLIKQLVEEAVKPGLKPASLYIGSFQPPTLGHRSAVEQMVSDGKGTPVVIVSGNSAKSSRFKEVVPLATKVELMETMTKGLNTVVLGQEGKDMWIGTILQRLEDEGFYLSALYAGPDRIGFYKSVLRKPMSKADPEIIGEKFGILEADKLNVEFPLDTAERFAVDGIPVSGTTVRQSLIDGDDELFNKLTGGYYSAKQYEYLKSIV
jgi:hypothetical protein